MKKLFTLMVCMGAAVPMFAATPNVVDLAKKAKTTAEARNYIQQAIHDPQLSQQAETYFVAGKIELDAYNDGIKNKMINPDDPSAQIDVMGKELIDAYNYFLKALPLDSLPNEKGQIKPRYSKDIVKNLKSYQNDFFSVGADYYNAQKYYPEAYEGFVIYGDIPSLIPEIQKEATYNPEQIATAFFNAGLAANQGGNMEASADAFKKARLAGYPKPEATIYEIACWQTITQQDENRSTEAQNKIMEAAQFGIDNFGIQEPIFINNLINSMINNGEMEESIATLNNLIAANPDVANLYGLRGYVYDRMEKDDLSEADYRKASSLPTADFETLKNTANKLYRVGAAKLNDIEGSAADTNNARQDIKQNYFMAAKELAQRADQMQPGDSYVQNLLESIDYALTTFFN